MENKKLKSLLEKLKGDLDNLEVQLNLGVMDAKQTFKKKRKEFSKTVKELETLGKEAAEEGSEKVKKMEEEANSLLELLEADFDFSYSEFNETPKKLDAFKEKLEGIFEEMGEGTEKAKSKFEKEYKDAMQRFELEMAIQKRRLEDNGEKFESWKEDILKETQELKGKLNNNIHVAEDKLDLFGKEMKLAVEHFKKAFKNLS
ncbi:hypothetical protein [Flexithrix dorotheae]|uniref:hypothetical protein n=1 Tax=Flexithrix dorotheae TaxID=70993 RepID=UPI00035C70DE|nr:hypothetical protein [Flexithrix dorotheae]